MKNRMGDAQQFLFRTDPEHSVQQAGVAQINFRRFHLAFFYVRMPWLQLPHGIVSVRLARDSEAWRRSDGEAPPGIKNLQGIGILPCFTHY